MATVALGIAQRVGTIMERLPSWREAGALWRRGTRPDTRTPLAAVIESEIIPRLLVAHRPFYPDVPSDPAMRKAIAPGDAERFAPRLIAHETADLLTEVEQLIAGGVDPQTLYLDLFAPAARLLGRLWDDDTYDFVDVTLGLWRLQELVREVQARAPVLRTPLPARRALLATAPGDQHSLGLVLLDEFFRQGGWETTVIPDGLDEDLVAMLETEPFDLVGLTVTRTDHLPIVPPLIALLRRRSLNRRICVMVGGAAIAGDSALAATLGADGTAGDARAAVAAADRLIGDSAAAYRC